MLTAEPTGLETDKTVEVIPVVSGTSEETEVVVRALPLESVMTPGGNVIVRESMLSEGEAEPVSYWVPLLLSTSISFS